MQNPDLWVPIVPGNSSRGEDRRFRGHPGSNTPVASRVHLRINRRGCAAGYEIIPRDNGIADHVGGKIKCAIATNRKGRTFTMATRRLQPILLLSLFLLTRSGGSIYLDREDLAAREFDLTTLLALIEPAMRVMQNRFRLWYTSYVHRSDKSRLEPECGLSRSYW